MSEHQYQTNHALPASDSAGQHPAFEAVDPISPAAPYCGGKRHLARALIEHINSIPHTTYAEPFVGMGGVFLRRTQKPPSEVINDLSGDEANFFRILQRHYAQFIEVLKFQLTSRREFERLQATDPQTLTDLERAARFLYLQKTAFGGKVTGRTFGIQPGQSVRFDIAKLGPMLEDLHERLAGVVIEALPYDEFIRRYDRDGTLFYLDPPYWGTEDYYGKSLFTRTDFKQLSMQLSAIKGRFILSLNDVPEIRKLFRDFHIRNVQVRYFLSHNQSKRAGELIVSNGEL